MAVNNLQYVVISLSRDALNARRDYTMGITNTGVGVLLGMAQATAMDEEKSFVIPMPRLRETEANC